MHLVQLSVTVELVMGHMLSGPEVEPWCPCRWS